MYLAMYALPRVNNLYIEEPGLLCYLSCFLSIAQKFTHYALCYAHIVLSMPIKFINQVLRIIKNAVKSDVKTGHM